MMEDVVSSWLVVAPEGENESDKFDILSLNRVLLRPSNGNHAVWLKLFCEREYGVPICMLIYIRYAYVEQPSALLLNKCPFNHHAFRQNVLVFIFKENKTPRSTDKPGEVGVV